jgi:dihydrodipicolinate synthase/N-acetylneuraminate lyase
MNLTRKFEGIIVANLTPFTADGLDIDERAYREHIEFMIQKGVHGLFPIGTMGEGMVLPLYLRKKAVDILVDQVKDRIDLIVQATAQDTAETIEFAKYCYDKGVHAIALVTPWFYPYDNKNLYEFFASVAKAVPHLPIFIYNNPGRSLNKISVDFTKKLSEEFDNIIGIKDSSKDMEIFQDYNSKTKDEFITIIGTDGMFYPGLCVGAKGIVTAIANSHPEIFVALWDAYHNGEHEKARELQFTINKMREIFKVGPYVSAYKYAIEKRGLSFGGFRSPMRDLTPEELTLFNEGYEKAEYIREYEKENVSL